jgi:site-specific DNA-methyltransferase (adenine-specific)
MNHDIIAPQRCSTDRYTMIHGECIAELVKMRAASVAAVFADPPYSSGGQYRGDRSKPVTTKYFKHGGEGPSFTGDNRDQRSFLMWAKLWLEECLRVSEDGAPIGIFADWRQVPIMTDALQIAGWMWRGIVPWDKENARPMPGRFSAQCEFILWGSKGAMPLRHELGYQPGIFRGKLLQQERFHITGKPSSLMQELVKVVPKDGIVLDPFAGSGSTGVGALREGRRFLGIELDAEYYARACDRLNRWKCDDDQYLRLVSKLTKKPLQLGRKKTRETQES